MEQSVVEILLVRDQICAVNILTIQINLYLASMILEGVEDDNEAALIILG